jgi:hypothetical protein
MQIQLHHQLPSKLNKTADRKTSPFHSKTTFLALQHLQLLSPRQFNLLSSNSQYITLLLSKISKK